MTNACLASEKVILTQQLKGALMSPLFVCKWNGDQMLLRLTNALVGSSLKETWAVDVTVTVSIAENR